MSKMIVTGGQRLRGEIAVEGSKNAVLPILAATVLNGGTSVIKNCPKLRDVEIAIEILKKIGCKVKMEDKTVIVDSSTLNSTKIPEELAIEMRSSIIFMGPMLARCGKVTISYPGGCVMSLAHKRNKTEHEYQAGPQIKILKH
ncbi:MAG TPA: UDP-N-acetylglucosamine 1-carboxyvinyltransferase [Clostridiales bacterium]|nr:UDP-N-acetylglucosamine 1-carboxyvinyltransferase [Clostridiales bacterium]